MKCPKNAFFLDLGTLYGEILTFSIFKKPFNVWNQLKTPKNNSTVHYWSYNIGSPENQQWWKNNILLFSSLIDGIKHCC